MFASHPPFGGVRSAHHSPLVLPRLRRRLGDGVGLATASLASLLANDRAGAATSATNPLAARQPQFAPKAKRVIYLFMAGAPSHLELFDNKPELAKWDGTLPPAELIKNYRAAFINPNSTLLGPKFKFAKHGDCGAELSELPPHLAGVVDDISIVKSMVTESNGACSTTRWSSGAASSAALRWSKEATTAATITRIVSACGWPAAA